MGLFERYGSRCENVKIDGNVYEAFFPKMHNSVAGIIFEETDRNPYRNSFGAFKWMHTICYLMPRGSTLWQKIHDDSSSEFRIGGDRVPTGTGIFGILQLLESAKFITLDEIAREERQREDEILDSFREHARKLGW